ncbi:MAG TPA: DUF1036 domain-containing protein [Rhizomicrobium sp.]|jgi:uncharacterized membrane protein|nr:DUF1036 domain-containing protein [Rhizomicrobium sp.]
MSVLARCLAAVTLVTGLLALASPAQAAMTVCNRTSYVQYVAAAAAVNGDALSQGWTRVAPGSCHVVLPGDLTASTYYLYAKSSQAHAGAARAWGGAVNICVKDTNFTARNRLSALSCDSDDFFQLPFAVVDTHRLKSWTATLSESPALATLPQAQLAGLKRLLHDIGYPLGAIDGKPDPATDKATADFRKRLRLAATATIDDLFDALETEALKTATPAGFSVCNDTAKSVAAALGQKARNDWISHGWWKIAAGSCAKLADNLLGLDSMFLFVQKIGGPPLVGGPNKFCVADIEFDIQGRGRCASRGLTETGFAEMRVKGLAGYAVHVGENGPVKPISKRPGAK